MATKTSYLQRIERKRIIRRVKVKRKRTRRINDYRISLIDI